MQKFAPVHIFGICESRLDARITDNLISVTDNAVLRRDSNYPLHTVPALYIHKSIENRVRRRSDLETETIECIWVEITDSKTKPLFVRYVYRNPASSLEWPDEFINMMDKVTENNENILLLGDFNINLFKLPHAWNNITSIVGLDQLAEEATIGSQNLVLRSRIAFTPTIGPEFVDVDVFEDVRIVESAISDHFAIFCHWSIQLPEPNLKGHTTVSFRPFKHFSETKNLCDFSQQSFGNVNNHCDPEEALSVWYDTVKTVIDRHAPVQQKRMKTTKPYPWLTPELILEMKKKETNLSLTGSLMNIRNKEIMYRPKLKKQNGSTSVK